MTEIDITSTSIEETKVTTPSVPVPVLLVARTPMDATAVDRCRLSANFTVGRKADNSLTVRDQKISGHHFRIFVDGNHFYVEDVGSTNGTYLDGERLTEKVALYNHAVIRAGHTVMVFHGDGERFLTPPPLDRYGMAGQFHVTQILKHIEEAALSKRHLLIAGPSGTGKELAAKAIATIISESMGKQIPYIEHNAARFTSEEEATSNLFGVGTRVFSNVNPRPGLIEQAEGGVLFLDEIHNLTERVQRSLLRVIEDSKYARIGETQTRVTNIRFVMASNAPDPYHSMAHDLFARLRLISIPPLSERRADIPTIFDHVLAQKLAGYDIPLMSVLPCLKGDHYALLCQDAFPADNVRGLIDLADRISTKIASDTSPAEAVAKIFSKRFNKKKPQTRAGTPPAAPLVPSQPLVEPTDDAANSTYDKYKDVIIATYKDREENISATMRALNARGISCSRRWLSVYLKRWGLKE